MWVHYAESETNTQSRQWKRVQDYADCFWDSHEIILDHAKRSNYDYLVLFKSNFDENKNQRKTGNVASQANPEKLSFCMTIPILILLPLQNLSTPSSGNC